MTCAAVRCLAGLALATIAAGGTAVPSAGRNVLVLGGTGALGAEIVRLLVSNGDRVTVFARPTSSRARLTGLPVTYVTGDLMTASDIGTALGASRFDGLIIAVRVTDGDTHFYEKFMAPLTAAAREAGVGQIVHSSAVGAGANAARFAGLGWEKVPGLLDRLRDQGVGEDIVRNSGVPYTIIRNTRLYPDGTLPTGKAELIEDDRIIGPMTRADLARLTVSCLGNAACLGKTYHVRDQSLAWPPSR